MATRAALQALLRQTLADRARWPDAALNQWINAALRDLSGHFGRRVEATIACPAGERVVSLAACSGLRAVLAVEFPAGREPPRWLRRRPQSGFFIGQPVYDLLGDPPEALVLGETPAVGESLAVSYLAGYSLPASDTAALDLPESLFELVRLFAAWQALQELEAAEALAPASARLQDALGGSAARAGQTYRAAVAAAQKARAPGGCAGPWTLDENDRIY